MSTVSDSRSDSENTAAVRSNRPVYLILASEAALTAFAAVILTILLCKFYEPDVMLFAADTPKSLLTALCVAVGIFALLTLAMAFASASCECKIQNRGSRLTLVGAIIFAAALASFALTSTVFELDGDSVRYLITLTDYDSSSSILYASTLAKIGAYLALFSLIYPLVLAITGKRNCVAALIASVWALSAALRVYFNITTPMNDPMRLMRIVGYGAAALALTLDVRISLSRLSARLLLTVGSMCACLSAAASLPAIITYIVGIATPDTDLFGSAATLAASLITAAAIIGALRKKAADEPQDDEEFNEENDLI